jgi:ABC-2 type transport system ATP-binding protein/Cu-processing system ATP-binding protein
MVEVRELSKYYQGLQIKKALQKVSYSVHPGEIFGLLGPNGAGKTTMIKILLGLLTPTGGEILVAGKKVEQNCLWLREKIGYLPERVTLYPDLTAWETIRFFAGLRGINENRCREVLKKVGLTDALNRRTGQFSKGMLQRLGLAQAILAKPELLILDEPTSGLDPEGVIQFKELIRQFNKEEGITIMFTSHILGEVQVLADRIGILHQGKLIALDNLTNLGTRMGLLPELQITLAQEAEKYLLTVKKAGAAATTGQGRLLTVTCHPQDKFAVLQALVAAGAEIIDFKVAEPGLEQIFLQSLEAQKGEENFGQATGNFSDSLEGISGKH